MLAAALTGAVALSGCGGGSEARRYSREKVQESLKSLETPGLVIGEFALAGKPVLDGDTIRVEGLDSTLRLLALDSEETIKDEQSRRDGRGRLAEATSRTKRGSVATPDQGRHADGRGGQEVRHQASSPASTRPPRARPPQGDPRPLRPLPRLRVRAQGGGEWLNYNVEAVRAGMSPYFTKYSYSRRFHDEFVAAEKEARAAKRGIWSPARQRLPRLRRAQGVVGRARRVHQGASSSDGKGRDDFIVLTHWDSLARAREEARPGGHRARHASSRIVARRSRPDPRHPEPPACSATSPSSSSTRTSSPRPASTATRASSSA